MGSAEFQVTSVTLRDELFEKTPTASSWSVVPGAMLGAEGVMARATSWLEEMIACGGWTSGTSQASSMRGRKSQAAASRGRNRSFFMVVVSRWNNGVEVSMIKV